MNNTSIFHNNNNLHSDTHAINSYEVTKIAFNNNNNNTCTIDTCIPIQDCIYILWVIIIFKVQSNLTIITYLYLAIANQRFIVAIKECIKKVKLT